MALDGHCQRPSDQFDSILQLVDMCRLIVGIAMAALQGFAAYSQYAANIWNSKAGALVGGLTAAVWTQWTAQQSMAGVPALTPASTMGA